MKNEEWRMTNEDNDRVENDEESDLDEMVSNLQEPKPKKHYTEILDKYLSRKN